MLGLAAEVEREEEEVGAWGAEKEVSHPCSGWQRRALLAWAHGGELGVQLMQEDGASEVAWGAEEIHLHLLEQLVEVIQLEPGVAVPLQLHRGDGGVSQKLVARWL